MISMLKLNHRLDQFQDTIHTLHQANTTEDKIKKLTLCTKIMNDMPLILMTIKNSLLINSNALEPHLLFQINNIEDRIDNIKS